MATNYADLAARMVLDAITKRIPGLTIKATFNFQIGEGTYDADTDEIVPVLDTYPDVVCVKAKPTAKDVADFSVKWNEAKLIVPGLLLPQTPDWEPNVDTDFVIIGNKRHGISKAVGTPGSPVWLIFVKRT